jgi:hypothetical protein
MKVCKKERLAEQKMMMAIKAVGMTNNEEGKMASHINTRSSKKQDITRNMTMDIG